MKHAQWKLASIGEIVGRHRTDRQEEKGMSEFEFETGDRVVAVLDFETDSNDQISEVAMTFGEIVGRKETEMGLSYEVEPVWVGVKMWPSTATRTGRAGSDARGWYSPRMLVPISESLQSHIDRALEKKDELDTIVQNLGVEMCESGRKYLEDYYNNDEEGQEEPDEEPRMVCSDPSDELGCSAQVDGERCGREPVIRVQNMYLCEEHRSQLERELRSG